VVGKISPRASNFHCHIFSDDMVTGFLTMPTVHVAFVTLCSCR
jgi:hypothetical protein